MIETIIVIVIVAAALAAACLLGYKRLTGRSAGCSSCRDCTRVCDNRKDEAGGSRRD